MSRNHQTVSLTLRPQTLKALDAAAQAERRSRSAVVDLMLERALITGDTCLRDLQAIADAGLEQFEAENAKRERPTNPAEVIAEASADGHSRLNALEKIAAGNRKTNLNGER